MSGTGVRHLVLAGGREESPRLLRVLVLVVAVVVAVLVVAEELVEEVAVQMVVVEAIIVGRWHAHFHWQLEPGRPR